MPIKFAVANFGHPFLDYFLILKLGMGPVCDIWAYIG